MPLLHAPTTSSLSDHSPNPSDQPTQSPATKHSIHASPSIIASPYTTPPHLLSLATLSLPQQLLARALTTMTPLRSDYATCAYALAFNWDAIITSLQTLLLAAKDFTWVATSFYVVVFRSQVKAGTDPLVLGALDERAHAEAVRSGGLLKYWFGMPDGGRRNLATCIWTGQEAAKVGGRGEAHREAARTTRDLYDDWRMERYTLEIADGEEGWRICEWAD